MLQLRVPWEHEAGGLKGLRFCRLDDGRCRGRVVAFDRLQGRLELDREPDEGDRYPTAFELHSDEESPIFAARLLTNTGLGEPLPPIRMRLATTLATNALLERAGAATALFLTRGFGDLLEIGNQQRPELFSLEIVKPAALQRSVVEVDERLNADGEVLRPLVVESLEERVQELLRAGITTAAVSLMHAYRNPDHEQRLSRQLLDWGFKHVSASAALTPRIKYLERSRTAVVNAYLAPTIQSYLDRVQQPLADNRLWVMTSHGALDVAYGYQPRDGLLSGPAGGVAGAAAIAARHGLDRLLTFDMGGTSTDVARIDGEFEYVNEQVVGDARLATQALAIETVAAGGGSICWLDGRRLRVGPTSASANPGPACYGAGGPLTVTDVNLLLGRLDPDRFQVPLDRTPARVAFESLLDELENVSGVRPDEEATLAGLTAIADETMADAMRRVSMRRGYDPAEHALVAFGGAGGQHACAVAERIGSRKVLIPADGALLSAWGLGQAEIERGGELQILERLDTVEASLESRFNELTAGLTDALLELGLSAEEISSRRLRVFLRLEGQESTIELPWHSGVDLREAFATRYVAIFGHAPPDLALEVESLRARVGTDTGGEAGEGADSEPATAPATRRHRCWESGSWRELDAYDRESLTHGQTIDGPAIVFDARSATRVGSAWHAEVLSDRSLLMSRSALQTVESDADSPEAIRLELFTRRFTRIVEEMGEQLQRTAVSTNVKERQDYSCALLDAEGELVANAPHIPVHLGALGLCVRRVAAALPLEQGDVVVTNHPAFGGSHLPDVTVITPVFERASGTVLLGYTASRAHHAEIGGIRPGSMPPDATSLEQEGVVIEPTYLLRAGEARWDAIARRLAAPPHPTRALADNLADLRAAVAANRNGATALRRLAATHSAGTVAGYMSRLRELAREQASSALRGLDLQRCEAVERLDDGSPIRVRIELDQPIPRIDFSGSAPVHPGNLNATPAIVHSAVLYVLRLLIDRELPLNEGLLRAVEIAPLEGMLGPIFGDDPSRCPAVVGGNVETSQRIVDTLLRALGIAACSQGTMNNVIFGNRNFGYYETVCGGAGAGADFDGASAVHTHMTNTRITDPEILEHRYPVRLERFSVRAGSGGAGRRRGGEGVIRELTFLEPAELSLLTQHRTEAPYGLEGGEPGQRGRQRLQRARGGEKELESICGESVEPGDRLLLETPGGGGFGVADPTD